MKFIKRGWKGTQIDLNNSVLFYLCLQQWRWLFFLLFICLSFFTADGAAAKSSESVSLVSFDGVAQVEGVALFWSTATELNSAGFRLTRTENDTTIPLDRLGPNGDGFIPAIGSPTLGADYAELDDTAVPATTYTYTLIEINLNADEVVLASIEVTAGVPPTYTPMAPPPTIAIRPTNPPPATETAVPTLPPAPIDVAPTETAVPPTTTPTDTPEPDLPTAVPVLHDVTDSQPVPVTPSERQPVSIAQAQSTPENGYPAPEPTPTLAVNDEAYPAAVIEPTAPGPSPYPVSTLSTNGFAATATPFNVIGADDAAPLSDNTPQDNAETAVSSGSSVYLWLGFLVALLIFGTAVFGSILLFVRRQR